VLKVLLQELQKDLMHLHYLVEAMLIGDLERHLHQMILLEIGRMILIQDI